MIPQKLNGKCEAYQEAIENLLKSHGVDASCHFDWRMDEEDNDMILEVKVDQEYNTYEMFGKWALSDDPCFSMSYTEYCITPTFYKESHG